MRDLELVKDFLRNKKSYLNEGNPKIQMFLSRKHNGRQISFKIITEARKQLREELSTSIQGEVEIKKDMKVSPEFIEKFNKLAEQLGVQPIKAIKEIKKSSEPTLKRKEALKTFKTPSIKDQAGMHLLLGCNHVPFHNKQLHKGILNLIKDHNKKIKGFHLMGDFIDLNPLSSHDKGRFTAIPGLTLNDEYRIGNKLLLEFDKALPADVWKTYLYGNHEDRHNRWMSVMDNAKTPLVSPEDGLKLWQRGYNVKTNWNRDFITLGNDFDIFHGVYFSIHNAKAHLDKLRRSCAYVHTHRIQNYKEGEMAAFNIGACADFTTKAFNYASRPMKQQWANGFAINMIDELGRSNITQISVTPDGHFWFGGIKY
jgi:hypothetical protein